MAKVIRNPIDGKGKRCAVAAAQFHESLTDRLVKGAIDTLIEHGVASEDVTVVWVPGAFELPQACRWLAQSGQFDAIIALGVVVRGETAHFEHVCTQAARGILDAAVATDVPIGFGVLTCDDAGQALARAGEARDRGAKGNPANKGVEAALAALQMIAVQSGIRSL